MIKFTTIRVRSRATDDVISPDKRSEYERALETCNEELQKECVRLRTLANVLIDALSDTLRNTIAIEELKKSCDALKNAIDTFPVLSTVTKP